MTGTVKMEQIGTQNVLIFMTHNFSWHYAMAMSFSVLIQHVTGFMIEVTECKHFISVLRYYQFCGGV